jgi:hypothetical protein
MIDLNHIEVIPKVEVPIVVETLARIGIANKKEKILYPSCYLYEDIDSRFFIYHFKELFLLKTDRSGYSNITEDDIMRKMSIVSLLVKWNLIEVVDQFDIETMFVFTIPFKEKNDWIVRHKINWERL